ncbi:MAG: 30S ribosomal protein S5 [Armatimonadota bacterium]|nr:30S ribosomal protein S5 [Armatimonadota bacterium]MDR7443067.1 30S ribosomal protein S5 [Armatimonadota bacterium]MDR7571130.1 30S ribosomal protein S5 [Armatimonadota bacterium]MDR7614479.1 30S ribosomal protein S5 [Armatimonadota bacterium]
MAEPVSPNEVTLSFEKTVSITRVAKVTQGAKRFNFRVMVVVGNQDGVVGVGIGKAAEVPDAIRKAVEDAKKNLVRIPRRGTTIPHEVIAKFGASEVLLKPAREGTGVIAAGAVRAVMDAAGIRDVLTKALGSTNPINLTRAAFKGLRMLRTPEEVAAARGKRVEEILGRAAVGG